ncbi:MAG: hypothetical protein CME24_03180 [Gemmatimonadetes bacterium]|nr:hypothetical protein [Gemmatimonadota bacterium]
MDHLSPDISPDEVAVFRPALPSQLLAALFSEELVDEIDELLTFFEDTGEFCHMVTDAVFLAQVTPHASCPLEEDLVHIDDQTLGINECCWHGMAAKTVASSMSVPL